MSDDQNSAPHSGDAAPTTPGTGDAETWSAPPAPPAPPAAPAYDAPAAPQYDAPAAPAYDASAYGAPAAPPYGAPAPYVSSPYGAAPYGPGYGAGYISPVQTNVLAIISLVASIAGFIWLVPVIGPITAVITGHISLAQIKRTGEKGRGMALAGTVIGWVGIAAIVVGVVGIIVVATVTAARTSRYGV